MAGYIPPELPEAVKGGKRPRSVDLLQAASDWERQLQLQHSDSPRQSLLGQKSHPSRKSTDSGVLQSVLQSPYQTLGHDNDADTYGFYAARTPASFKRHTGASDASTSHLLKKLIPDDELDEKPTSYDYLYETTNPNDQLFEVNESGRWLPKDVEKLPAGNEKPQASQPPAPPPAPSAGTHFTAREVLFIICVCAAQLLSLAGLAQTVAPVVRLAEIFDFKDPGRTAWPTAAYSLTLGSMILPAGRLGDMFGHRKLLLIGWVWFGAASLGCGFSYMGGSATLIGCRAVQGIGPALCVPNGLALFGRTFPIGMKRNIAMGLFGGMGPVGFVLGATFSSLLTELDWWPCGYWAMSIACGLVAIMSYFVIPPDKLKLFSKAGHHLWVDFDLLGAVTGVGGLVLINFALNEAPIVNWTEPYIGVLLGVGLISMCAFIYIELRVATYPLIPIKKLHRNAAFTLACIAAGWGSHGIWLYYLFLLFEEVRGHTMLSACAMIWPVAPVGFVAALGVGFLQKKIKVPYLMSIAMFCFLMGSLLLATAPAHQTYFANTLVSILITPFGMNWSFPTGVILMSNAVPRENQGIAASLVSTMVNYSISTGLGFAGSIDRYVSTEHGTIAGYRGAWYFGVGLSTLGLLISFYFIWQTRVKS